MLGTLRVPVFSRIGEEAKLTEHSRAAVPTKHVKIVAFDATVVAGVSASGLAQDVGGKTPRSRAEVVDFNSASAAGRRPIVVNAHEYGGSRGVGARNARFQRYKNIAGPRFDHAEALTAENRGKPPGGVKREDFFRGARNRAAARIMSSMSRIDDDRIKLPGAPLVRRYAACQKKRDDQCCVAEGEARDVENMAAISCFLHTKSLLAARAGQELGKVRERALKATN